MSPQKTKIYRRVLTIAGSDSGGGAGIQADLKTIAANGGYGLSVITALTAQNTQGVKGIHPVPVDFVAQSVVRLIENPANHRRVFHITHPNPPTYNRIWQYVSSRFGLAGVRFAGAAAQPMQPRNELERLACCQMESVLDYFGNNPLFERSNYVQALPDLSPPEITEELMDLWLAYAIDNDWGQ